MNPQITFPRQLLRRSQMVSRFVVLGFPWPIEHLGHLRLRDAREMRIKELDITRVVDLGASLVCPWTTRRINAVSLRERQEHSLRCGELRINRVIEVNS